LDWLKGVSVGPLRVFRAVTTPSPQHRPRVTQRGITFYPKAYQVYHTDCVKQFATQLKEPIKGPVGVVVETVCARPKTTKLRAPRGDSDNYAKAPLDAATKAGVWGDDARYIETYWSRFPGVWTHGDWASIDADGYWYLHGRSDDTLNIAGKRVGPAELESAAIGSGIVVEAAAVGIPHEVKGEVAWIFCVAAPGTEPDDARVATAVTDVLGKAFKPDRILWVAALPKTRSAKIVRRAVRARALGKDPGDVSSLENPESLEEIRRVAG